MNNYKSIEDLINTTVYDCNLNRRDVYYNIEPHESNKGLSYFSFYENKTNKLIWKTLVDIEDKNDKQGKVILE
jgi:hypothetical protein